MKKFKKDANNLKELLLSYSNRTIRTNSPDRLVLWYRTPDFNKLGERLRIIRRASSLYGITKNDRDYRCKTLYHLNFKTAEMYPMYVISITLWKTDNGKAES